MPHLQFETTIDIGPSDERSFSEAIADRYAEIMETGTGHVAISVRDEAETSFFLGRLDPDEPALMLNADIRAGRTFEQQRAFVRAAFDEAHDRWRIPTENMYAVVTEHSGNGFHEYDRVLASWDPHETGEGAD